MRPLHFVLFCCAISALTSAVLAEERFVPLFNGKNLEGWNADPEFWRVENGVIIGSTEKKQSPQNSFVSTKKSFRNFVLRAKFKLFGNNSGIQFRSVQRPDFLVSGYQADIAENAFMGILYEEGGRGVLANVDSVEVAKHVHKGDWNQYVITANGKHVKLELNGFTTVDYLEKDPNVPTDGIIAMQLNAGSAMQVEFKDVELCELP